MNEYTAHLIDFVVAYFHELAWITVAFDSIKFVYTKYHQ